MMMDRKSVSVSLGPVTVAAAHGPNFWWGFYLFFLVSLLLDKKLQCQTWKRTIQTFACSLAPEMINEPVKGNLSTTCGLFVLCPWHSKMIHLLLCKIYFLHCCCFVPFVCSHRLLHGRQECTTAEWNGKLTATRRTRQVITVSVFFAFWVWKLSCIGSIFWIYYI